VGLVLRVSIGLLPGGRTAGAHELAAVAIARIAEASAGRSSYAAIIERGSGPSLGAQVTHLSRHGPLVLVRHVLDAACIDGVAMIPADVRGHLARVAELRLQP
jgi:hypothetical protein